MNTMTLENLSQSAFANAQAFLTTHKKTLMMLAAFVALAVLSIGVMAATTSDTWANSGYDFIYNAATGKFTRAICIAGGIIAVLSAAGSGKYILALGGVVLAMFGFLSPTLINAIFGTATI